jgi:glycosyltransferase involved in cell wall biosynthesis
MKVSIITATFNSINSIEDTFNSIKSQDYEDIEWIVIDGGSTDGTIEYLKSVQHKISKFISEKDNGIYDALNKGLSLATGDVVGFLHSDDVFANEIIISNIVKLFQEKQIGGVYGDLEYISQNENKNVIRKWKSSVYDSNEIKKGWMPPHPTLFLKREIYEKFGNFDEKMKISADYDFILRIMKSPEIYYHYFPAVITKMKMGGASSSLRNIKQKMKEDILALKKNNIGNPYRVIIQKNLAKVGQFF